MTAIALLLATVKFHELSSISFSKILKCLNNIKTTDANDSVKRLQKALSEEKPRLLRNFET